MNGWDHLTLQLVDELLKSVDLRAPVFVCIYSNTWNTQSHTITEPNLYTTHVRACVLPVVRMPENGSVGDRHMFFCTRRPHLLLFFCISTRWSGTLTSTLQSEYTREYSHENLLLQQLGHFHNRRSTESFLYSVQILIMKENKCRHFSSTANNSHTRENVTKPLVLRERERERITECLSRMERLLANKSMWKHFHSCVILKAPVRITADEETQ